MVNSVPKPLEHRIVDRIPGLISEIIVYERGQYRSVHFSNGPDLNQGRRHRFDSLGFTSEYLKQVLATTAAHPAPERVLCLGLGIGAIPTLIHAVHPGVHLDAVELDPGMLKAAQRHFGLKVDHNFKVYIDDANTFLERKDIAGLYDLVIIDCYDQSGIAAGCESLTFYTNAATALATGGVLISNIVPGRSGATSALISMRSVTRHPWALSARTKSNWTVVGMKQHILDLPEMIHRAERIDQLNCLPYPLASELAQARPSWELLEELNRLSESSSTS